MRTFPPRDIPRAALTGQRSVPGCGGRRHGRTLRRTDGGGDVLGGNRLIEDTRDGADPALDFRDPALRRLLRALVADARLDAGRIAALTGASVEAIQERIAELERRRIIRGYKTVVDWERLGDDRVVAFIDVSVSPQRDVGFDQVAARIYRHPEVRSVHLVSGGHDLRIIVEAPTMREIASFVSEKLAPIDHVTATNTHFLLKAYKEDGDILVDDVPADDRLPVTP